MASLAGHHPTGTEDFGPKKLVKANSWERVLVFDPESNNVDIRTKRQVDEDMGYCSYKPLDLPKRRKSVSLYMEQNDELKLKTVGMLSEGDRFLARLTLDHLSLANKALFLLGLISTLYVAVDPQSSGSSLKE